MIKSITKEKRVYLIVFILSIISFIGSIMVYQLHQGDAFASSVCSIVGNISNCEAVGSSPYAKLLGFDNSFMGIVGFLFMLLLSGYLCYRNSELFDQLLLAGGVFSSMLAIYFLFLQTFVINAYCTYCVIVDICSIVICYVLVKKKLKN